MNNLILGINEFQSHICLHQKAMYSTIVIVKLLLYICILDAHTLSRLSVFVLLYEFVFLQVMDLIFMHDHHNIIHYSLVISLLFFLLVTAHFLIISTVSFIS
jgi:hypothetical protein